MTNEEAMRICTDIGVHEGGMENWVMDNAWVKFADLVAAHTLMNIDPSKFIGGYQEGFEAGAAKEREECAKVAEKRVLLDDNKDKKIGYNHACKVIAESIRARGTR